MNAPADGPRSPWGAPWGVPAYEGPDSPQSSVPLCPVCLHPADSEAHRAAVERMNKRADEMRARDAAAAAAARQITEARAEAIERVKQQAEEIRAVLTPPMEPGSITSDQRRTLAALLIDRDPVFRLESMTSFLTSTLGEPWPATRLLSDLSARQAGDLLEALENERRATRTPPRHAAGDYQPKRAEGTPARRQTRGAHRR